MKNLILLFCFLILISCNGREETFYDNGNLERVYYSEGDFNIVEVYCKDQPNRIWLINKFFIEDNTEASKTEFSCWDSRDNYYHRKWEWQGDTTRIDIWYPFREVGNPKGNAGENIPIEYLYNRNIISEYELIKITYKENGLFVRNKDGLYFRNDGFYGYYKDGKQEGEWRSYRNETYFLYNLETNEVLTDGTIAVVENYKDGVKDGEEIQYLTDGRVIKTLYKDGEYIESIRYSN